MSIHSEKIKKLGRANYARPKVQQYLNATELTSAGPCSAGSRPSRYKL